MNLKPIFNLFSSKGKTQTLIQQGVSALIISLVALLLVALTACMQVVPASEPVAAVAPAQAEASEQHSIETLPNIDPADRKFFSPGYGAISDISKEAEVLPAAGVESHPLAWPPRPTQLYSAENVGVSLDENALAIYHQSEWGRTPSTVVPMAEDPLAKYHQSEWGRALRPILPIVEDKANADQDIGLMEVFTLVSEAGLPRHDREYGLAAFSTVPAEVTEADPLRAVNETGLARYHESEWGFAPNKADADGDMGLMEFFAAPNETNRERTDPGALETLPNIDPADRKFFNPGYGAQADMPGEAEALPAIDPADRKFFNPSYGATSGVSEEAEVLPTVDPADRKFINFGYGAQTTGAKPSEAIPASIDNEMGEWSAIWFLLK
ncbi:MAG TPA: hypothetical protein VEC93_07580 [Anaerolineae bacterium]|nr:hypothetical protein [Anaerolineae bacterium]